MTAKIMLVPLIVSAVILAFFAGRWTAPEQPPIVHLMVPASLLDDRDRPEMVDVLIAKKELVVGNVLDEKELESMIGTQKIQKSNLPPDIINTAEELVGKKLNRTLKAGNFFSAGDVSKDTGIRLPEGLSKYSIRFDRMNGLSVGGRVDVYADEVQSNGRSKSARIGERLLVLQIDESGTRSRPESTSVAIAVTPLQALTFSAAEKRGEVKLILSNPASD